MATSGKALDLTQRVNTILGSLVRDIIKREGDPANQQPYCIVVPYAFIINGKPVKHTHPVWVDAADSFEDAKERAISRFYERVREGVLEGFDPHVVVYYDKIRQVH